MLRFYEEATGFEASPEICGNEGKCIISTFRAGVSQRRRRENMALFEETMTG
jgi:hypothetical protein